MEKQKKFSLKNYLYEYKWWYVFGIAILLCVDLANIYIPQFIGDIIDGLTNETLTKAGIPMMLMKILIAGLIMMFGRFGWRYCILVHPERLNIVLEMICLVIWKHCQRVILMNTKLVI